MCLTVISMNRNKKISKHYKEKRYKRERLINRHLNGDGKVIDSFIVDKEHKDGIERHDITENGIILVFNAKSGKLVTKLIAREGQLKRLYHSVGREPPHFLIQLARWHKDLNYNR